MKLRTAELSNRRQSERRETCLKAQISYGPKDGITLDCTIRNISSGGAMLDVPADRLLPPAFRLINIGEGFAYDAHIVWRRGPQIGVYFSGAADLRAAASPKTRALRAVWERLAGGLIPASPPQRP